MLWRVTGRRIDLQVLHLRTGRARRRDRLFTWASPRHDIGVSLRHELTVAGNLSRDGVPPTGITIRDLDQTHRFVPSTPVRANCKTGVWRSSRTDLCADAKSQPISRDGPCASAGCRQDRAKGSFSGCREGDAGRALTRSGNVSIAARLQARTTSGGNDNAGKMAFHTGNAV